LPIDLLVIVSDCSLWPKEVPPFPVITIRVGDGTRRRGNQAATK
jgi:hypothetical protein